MIVVGCWVTFALSVICSFIGANTHDPIQGGVFITAAVGLFLVGGVLMVAHAAGQHVVWSETAPWGEENQR